MKTHFILLAVITTFAIRANAQGVRLHMWFNGDQDKPMPSILLAVDSFSLKEDTIAVYKYLISQQEFLEIRNIFFDRAASDSIDNSVLSASFDFTIIGAGSYSTFFTKSLGLLEKRFVRILGVISNNFQYEAVKRNMNDVLSRLKFLKGFPR